MRLKDVKILWTSYFDSSLTRREGRRLPRGEAVPRPKFEELERACRRLGLEVVEGRKSRYPRNWWLPSGYVAIKSELKKSELIKLVGRELRRLRGLK